MRECGPRFSRTLLAILMSMPALCMSPLCVGQDVVRMGEIVRYHVDNMAFMGSVLVARDGEVLFGESYGSANLDWDVPNTAGTKFQIGSITKQFTAAAILLLEERGSLALDDRIGDYLSDIPRAWRRITVFDLLTHTSGIPDLLAIPGYGSFKRSPATVQEIIGFFRDEALDFRPGERMSYSNSGYVLLGHLIEEVSGQSYERFLTENFFLPLGMRHSGFGSHSEIVPSLAVGYERSEPGFVRADFIDMTVLHGAGALYSTTGDLLRWTRGLFDGELISEGALVRMTTPFEDDYALGVEVREAHGRRVVEHGGGVEGFNAHLAHYPGERITVAVLGNVNGLAPEQIAWQLGATVFGEDVQLPPERRAIELASDRLEEFTGHYRSESAADLIVAVSAGQLTIRLGARPPVPLFPESGVQFFARVIDAQVEFERDAEGNVNALLLRRVNRERRALRVRER